MTLYEKLHTASKEELAEFLALSYGLYSAQNNEMLNNDQLLGLLAYSGFGVCDAVKETILKEMDTELEDLQIIKKFKERIESVSRVQQIPSE